MRHQTNLNEDFEATEFALELLMPSQRLLRDCTDIDILDAKSISKLAKKYGVSNEMIVYRMGQLREGQREK